MRGEGVRSGRVMSGRFHGGRAVQPLCHSHRARDRTRYSLLMSRARTAAGESQLDVPDDWLQGRTLFGGLQAAVALAAMRSLVPQAPLRSLQATFLAPVPAGVVRSRARVLRSGQSTTYVERRIVSGDDTLALFIGVFGLPRPSSVRLIP